MNQVKNFLKHPFVFAYFILTLTCLFWAGNFIMGRGVHEIVPPMALSFWRWLLATCLLLPFAWPYLKRDWPNIKTHLGYFTLMGFLGGASFNALTYLALHTTTATNALILNAANALLIVLANYLLHKIRPTVSQLIAIFMAIIGILYIIAEGQLEILYNLSFNIGDILVILSMISWALYTALLLNKPETHWISFAVLTFAAATILLIPPLIIEMMLGFHATVNYETVSAILFAAIFPATLAYVFYSKAVEIIGGNRAGIMIYLMPFFGTILGFLVLNERPYSYHFIGLSLIMGGVVLAAIKGKSKS